MNLKIYTNTNKIIKLNYKMSMSYYLLEKIIHRDNSVSLVCKIYTKLFQKAFK